MAGNGNPYNKANMKAGKGKIVRNGKLEPMGGSSWSPWQLSGKVFGYFQGKPNFENPKDYGTSGLERKNEKIMKLEKAVEEEKRKIEKNERDNARLKENKEKHRITDQKLKDLRLELENAKNKNKNNDNQNKNKNKNGKFGVGGIQERPVWIGRKN